ncbi:MAG TPA: hypothetical protein V6C72_19040 [Chroococcales cyanobacterium]
MKHIRLLVAVATLSGSISAAAPGAMADQFRLPEEIGRVEAPRDMNLVQVEPSVLHERYYTSGKNERHQFVGTTLPFGSPIPDNEGPMPLSIGPRVSAGTATGATTGTATTTTTTTGATGGTTNASGTTVLPAGKQ